MRSAVVFLALGSSLMACSATSKDETGTSPITQPILCTMEATTGISVEVRDAASGAPAACGASGTFEEGAFVKALVDAGQCSRTDTWPYLYGVVERAGTYRVTVTRQGYRA